MTDDVHLTLTIKQEVWLTTLSYRKLVVDLWTPYYYTRISPETALNHQRHTMVDSDEKTENKTNRKNHLAWRRLPAAPSANCRPVISWQYDDRVDSTDIVSMEFQPLLRATAV